MPTRRPARPLAALIAVAALLVVPAVRAGASPTSPTPSPSSTSPSPSPSPTGSTSPTPSPSPGSTTGSPSPTSGTRPAAPSPSTPAPSASRASASASASASPSVLTIPTTAVLPGDLSAVEDKARAAAAAVAQVSAQLTTATVSVANAQQVAITAQARYDSQVSVQRAAARAAASATVDARTAQAAYDHSRVQLVALIQYLYETGGPGIASLGGLLTSNDPSGVLNAVEIDQMLSTNVAQVLRGNAAAAHTNAAAQARASDAVAAARTATSSLRSSLGLAQTSLQASQDALQGLRDDLLAARASQTETDAVLSTFLGGWSVADPARAGALNAKYLTLAQRIEGQQDAPRSSSWTAAMGRTAANRALLRIGTPYAWDGGSPTGPTAGVCAGGDAANDCHLVGFDCSGLSLYGWSPYLDLTHSAAEQYSLAGSLHPDLTALQPGDLVFWSSDGQVAGIHHVAIYVGGGLVVQAPESGDIVRVTPLGSVDSGYFGATRPLT